MININLRLNENRVYIKSNENNNNYKIIIYDWKLYSDPNKIITEDIKEIIYINNNYHIVKDINYWFQPGKNMLNIYGVKIEILDLENNLIQEEKFKIKTKHGKIIKEQIIVHHATGGLGDVLFLSPTIKKLYEIYNKKINIYTFFPELFINNPYVDNNYKINDRNHLNEIINTIDTNKFDIHHTGHFQKKPFGIFDINRNLTNVISLEIGLSITNEENKLYFYPDEYQKITELPEKYIVINPSTTQAHRTWTIEKWNKLIELLENEGFFIVALGKDLIHGNEINASSHLRSSFKNDIIIKNGLNLINDIRQDTISQAWHIISNSIGVITFPSGLATIAITTKSKIFYLSYNMKISDYLDLDEQKYTMIEGDCKLYCNSSYDKSISEHGILNIIPWYGCPLYNEFKCHPTPEQVYESILKNIRKNTL